MKTMYITEYDVEVWTRALLLLDCDLYTHTYQELAKLALHSL